MLETLAAAGLVPLVDAFWVEVDDARGQRLHQAADLYARMAALGFAPRVGAGAAAHYDKLFARPSAGWVPEAPAPAFGAACRSRRNEAGTACLARGFGLVPE